MVRISDAIEDARTKVQRLADAAEVSIAGSSGSFARQRANDVLRMVQQSVDPNGEDEEATAERSA